MKATLAIAAAEIRQNKLVFWAGLAFGALPLFLHFLRTGALLRPALPGQPESSYAFMVTVIAVGFSLAIAILMGATVISRDIGERRLGFWLSRPVPLVEYWAAKLGAAFFLAASSAVFVGLPAHLLGALRVGDTLASLSRSGPPWLVMLGLAVAGAAAAGGAFRSRSGLLLLDVVMWPLTGAVTLFAFASCVEVGADGIVLDLIRPTLLIIAILVLLAASAAQVCIGRFDFRRGHLALSIVAWGGLLIFFAGGILGIGRYVAAGTPADVRLSGAFFHPSPAGRQVMIEGRAALRGGILPLEKHWAAFLLDETGKASLLGGSEGMSRFAWSRDGAHFAWARAGLIGSESVPAPLSLIPGFAPSLHVQRLDQNDRVRRLPLDAPSSVLAVSPSGRRVLLATGLSSRRVVEAATGELVASLDGEPSWWRAAFLSENIVRALRKTNNQQASIVEWNLAARGSFDRGWLPLGLNPFALLPSDDWEHVLRVAWSGLYLHDLEGRIVATFVSSWRALTNHEAGLLSLGRYGCIEEEEPGELHLRVFNADGRTQSEARFKGRFPIRVGGEPRPGLLALSPASLGEGQRSTLFVDIADGSITKREQNLLPALRRWEFARELDPANPEPGSLSTRLFLDRDDRLLTVDPTTWSRSVIVTPRARSEN